jgi:hypothetical protein
VRVRNFREGLDNLEARAREVELLGKIGKMTRLRMFHTIASHTSYLHRAGHHAETTAREVATSFGRAYLVGRRTGLPVSQPGLTRVTAWELGNRLS